MTALARQLHHLRDAACVVAVRLVDLHLQHRMSVLGQSLPIHSGPVSANVRNASDSDKIADMPRMTLCAIRDRCAGHMCHVHKSRL